MRIATAAAWLLFFVGPAMSETISGKAVHIADGDTFVLLDESHTQVTIRLGEIDAPEAGQPYGAKSKQALADLIDGQQVDVQVQTKDRYGRAVGRPFVGETDVCEEMIRIGAAWVYRDYVIDRTLLDVEIEAKASKRGIWGLAEAQQIAPWNWRRGLEGGGVTPQGCMIKGNINNKGDKIYHAPGMSSYGATRIDESKGERWFCSEAEATASGWRAPRG